MPSKFDQLLNASATAHGHLCPGQVIGVRMALLGCRLIGFDLPLRGNDIKKIIVYVEMDRCASDALAHTIGVKLGRRSLKFVDFGVMAATFINLATDQAYRVISTEESRDLASVYAPEVGGKMDRQLLAYRRMPDHVLFRVQKVRVKLNEWDMPGPTKRKVFCQECGQVVRDGREVVVNGRALCRPCAGLAYFEQAEDVNWPNMDYSPDSKPVSPPCDKEPEVDMFRRLA